VSAFVSVSLQIYKYYNRRRQTGFIFKIQSRDNYISYICISSVTCNVSVSIANLLIEVKFNLQLSYSVHEDSYRAIDVNRQYGPLF